MQTYKVTSVGAKIEKHTTKKPLFNRDGSVDRTEDVVVEYVDVHVTDGSRWAGGLVDFVWSAPPGAVEVGDIVSGFDRNGYLRDVIIVEGKNAIATPNPPIPTPAPSELPPVVEAPQAPSWMASVMNGCAMSGQDLKDFASYVLDLAQRHKNLAAAFRQHLAEHGEK